VRGVRTDEWKYIRYPDGAGGDQYKPELYNLKKDPLETDNLIDDPAYADKAKQLRMELARLIAKADGLPDNMPVHPEMKMELPDEEIR
jgi:arylsulfatase A-like enzyme